MEQQDVAPWCGFAPFQAHLCQREKLGAAQSHISEMQQMALSGTQILNLEGQRPLWTASSVKGERRKQPIVLRMQRVITVMLAN